MKTSPEIEAAVGAYRETFRRLNRREGSVDVTALRSAVLAFGAERALGGGDHHLFSVEVFADISAREIEGAILSGLMDTDHPANNNDDRARAIMMKLFALLMEKSVEPPI